MRQDLKEAKRDTEEGWNNVVLFEAPNKPVTALSDDEPIDGEVEVKPADEEQPWYVPERTSRRRLREEMSASLGSPKTTMTTKRT